VVQPGECRVVFTIRTGDANWSNRRRSRADFFPSSFLVDAEGALWIGMGNGVVLRRHAGEWQEFNQTNGVPFSYIYCLRKDIQGKSGLARMKRALHVSARPISRHPRNGCVYSFGLT